MGLRFCLCKLFFEIINPGLCSYQGLLEYENALGENIGSMRIRNDPARDEALGLGIEGLRCGLIEAIVESVDELCFF